jgi:hypothetical protein
MSAISDPTAPVFFDRGAFSNFHPSPIVLPCPYTGEARTFATTEHYFQAAKVAPHFVAAGDPAGYVAVALAASPGLCKRLARRVPLADAELRRWNNGRSFASMVVACGAKFAQHPDLAEQLLGTGSRPLTEHRPDPIWGDNLDGTGRNLLGLVLMVVRDGLR